MVWSHRGNRMRIKLQNRYEKEEWINLEELIGVDEIPQKVVIWRTKGNVWINEIMYGCGGITDGLPGYKCRERQRMVLT